MGSSGLSSFLLSPEAQFPRAAAGPHPLPRSAYATSYPPQFALAKAEERDLAEGRRPGHMKPLGQLIGLTVPQFPQL